MATPITPEYLARSGTEHGEQMALFCWKAQALKDFPYLQWMFAIPNGGGRSIAQAAGLKAEGVKRGVADVFLPLPKGRFHGLWIEMKRPSGVVSDVSDDQIAFAKYVKGQDYWWEVCYSWQEAVNVIVAYYCGNQYDATDRQLKVYDRIEEYEHD